ncbi:MAG: lysoplasmalogenase [Saprospiraceae bacterium]|nr:lysoplasmalogenase [Saprospiraceae bacterium]
MKRFFPYLFVIIFLLQLTGVYLDSPLKLFTKPFIMISLASFYFAYARNFRIVFFTALVAALMGDIFLMWDHEMSFMLGLGSFLVMQVLYALIFWDQRDKVNGVDIAMSTVIALVAAGLMYILIPDVDGFLKIAVAIYCLCIMVMVITAILRERALLSYLPVLCGALLFMLSDAVLAIDKFSFPMEYGRPMVMGTYMAAQYLIVMGISKTD